MSRVLHTLESEYEQWKSRQLVPHYAYAFADGTYFTVIYNGQGCKMPILAVVAHIPQFAFAIFTKSLVERIAKEEFLINSTIQIGLSPEFSKKLRNVSLK